MNLWRGRMPIALEDDSVLSVSESRFGAERHF
jgi:hypothetical protein